MQLNRKTLQLHAIFQSISPACAAAYNPVNLLLKVNERLFHSLQHKAMALGRASRESPLAVHQCAYSK
jgi:hypothetical protein